MSEATSKGEIFTVTTPVEMVFPHLHEPRKFKGKGGREQGEAKYDAMFVFDADHADLPAIKDAFKRIAKTAFPGVELKNVRFPLRAGDKIADEAKTKTPPKDNEFLRGRVCITARSIYPPRLSVNMPGRGFVSYQDEARDTSECKKAFYAGVHVLTELNFYPNEVDGNCYITAYVNRVASLNKGERRAGGKSDNEVFAGYKGHVSAEDPTAGMEMEDEEIPY